MGGRLPSGSHCLLCRGRRRLEGFHSAGSVRRCLLPLLQARAGDEGELCPVRGAEGRAQGAQVAGGTVGGEQLGWSASRSSRGEWGVGGPGARLDFILTDVGWR